jgi:hypothetical protein
MNWKKIVFVVAALALVSPAYAADDPADSDTTPVSACESLPHSVQLVVMSRSDTQKVCNVMLRVLEGVRNKDITQFSKYAYILQAKGYEKDRTQIVAELVEIIRLRGLYDKPDRWEKTNEISWRSFAAFHGVVTPADTIALLNGAGPMAKTLSDDGLRDMLIVMKRTYQSGEKF